MFQHLKMLSKTICMRHCLHPTQQTSHHGSRVDHARDSSTFKRVSFEIARQQRPTQSPGPESAGHKEFALKTVVPPTPRCRHLLYFFFLENTPTSKLSCYSNIQKGARVKKSWSKCLPYLQKDHCSYHKNMKEVCTVTQSPAWSLIIIPSLTPSPY